MAIVVVIAGTWLGYQQLSDSGCTGSVRLTVAAAPEITPAVQRVAQQWTTAGAEVGGTCVAVDVTDELPADIAGAVSREHDVALAGLGTAPETVQVPDVWIPDSSTWLLRLQSEASGFKPTNVASIAQSPVVLAMPEPVAKNFGWPEKKMSWEALLGQFGTENALQVGIVDPTRDASGLSSLLAIGAMAGNGNKQQALLKKTQALTALAENDSSLRDELLAQFPKSGDANDLGNSLQAAPLSEEDVVAYNAQRPAVQLSALYLDPAPVPLDYPYSIMPQVVESEKAAAATALLAQLTGASAKDALAGSGLRAPDGTYGAGFQAPVGAPAASPAVKTSGGSSEGGSAGSGISGGVLSQAVGSWIATTLPGRVLAVFDVSGSMEKPVPTAGNQSRATVTQEAARGGLALFNNKWAVGVWRFSTKLDGSLPYKELVPITPLTNGRQKLQESIDDLDPVPLGDTGLYDTVLAAYKKVQEKWAPGRSNSVILFTDGENQNPDGLNEDQLLAELKKVQDPRRPVRLVLIGIGNEVNENELKTISKAVKGSGVFIAEDPARISDIFLEAIGTRTGAS
ncbi:substrate-binding domain-containing protein [Actinoplanes sp. DH11]|uniref:substrate-binding domain-containing protein n=1 Tax=Actinoplanes sp. DH11 TaxID=2857011 RepID=UPI001E4750B0|nr:substrate-binding domain-containing protein [Actinoplanes sp. DH11]